MRSKTNEDGREWKFTRRDLMAGESPWNGRREVVDPSVYLLPLPNPKHTTEEKLLIQPPSSASSVVTTWMQSIIRVLV